MGLRSPAVRSARSQASASTHSTLAGPMGDGATVAQYSIHSNAPPPLASPYLSLEKLSYRWAYIGASASHGSYGVFLRFFLPRPRSYGKPGIPTSAPLTSLGTTRSPNQS